MHENLEQVCKTLDALSTAVSTATSENRTLCEAYGWNCPAVTRQDLAAIPARLAAQIRETALEELDPNMQEQLAEVPRRLQHMQAQTVPQLFNGGNVVNAAPAYLWTMESLRQTLEPLWSWQRTNDPKMMPHELARRLRSMQAELDQLTPKKEDLLSSIKLIQDARATAESLPTDMQALSEARNKVDKLSTDSAVLCDKIIEKRNEALEATSSINRQHEKVEKLVAQCEDAYQITTTKGLAAAFDERAHRISTTMWVWVVGLLVSLAAGAYLGAQRIQLLSNAITPSPDWGVIWMHIALSVLSVGAPLWFAWLSTKQIAQRFRLAEDYGFKASVAKAYEGYRKEAARIDPAFEARLFGSALTRLEEAPLRLMESSTHGSPWHELVSSEPFRRAMDLVPELKDKFIGIAKSLASEGSATKAAVEAVPKTKD